MDLYGMVKVYPEFDNHKRVKNDNSTKRFDFLRW